MSAFFGRAAALDDYLIRRLCPYGAYKCEDLCLAYHLCPVGVRGNLLILELDQPFTGMMIIPSEPLRNALPASVLVYLRG